MKSKLRRLTLAALLLSSTSMTFADDGATGVGDLPGYDTATEPAEKAKSSGLVGDLEGFGGSDFKGNQDNHVSDSESNYVSDESTNVVSDLDAETVSKIRPAIKPVTERGTVVIGLAPNMLTDIPESVRSEFIEAVPPPIIAAPTAVSSNALIDPAEVNAKAKQEVKADGKVKAATTNPAKSDEGLQDIAVQPFQAIAFKPDEKEAKQDAAEPASESDHKPATESNCDCGESCDGGCESASRRKHSSRIGRLFDRCPEDSWLSSEFLFWHTQDRESPPLVARSAPGTFPVLPNAQVLFGDDLEGEFSGGFRLDAGKYLTDNLGVGGRFWILANNNDSFGADAFPTEESLGRPFFNAEVGTEDSLLISGPAGSLIAPGPVEGTFFADSSINMWGAEAYTRLRLNCGNKCNVQFLSGYSHLNVDDSLEVHSVTFSQSTADLYEFHDYFDTRNQFNGGQLGFELSVTEGRWTFRSMTKVHLGNMNQQVSIAGNHVSPTDSGSGGLLALGNQGNFERDKFAFIPEANFKLECQIRRNVSLSLGYSFLYFDNLALAGAQVDPVINPLVPTPLGIAGPPWPNRPAFNFKDSGMWVQGLDFGLKYNF